MPSKRAHDPDSEATPPSPKRSNFGLHEEKPTVIQENTVENHPWDLLDAAKVLWIYNALLEFQKSMETTVIQAPTVTQKPTHFFNGYRWIPYEEAKVIADYRKSKKTTVIQFQDTVISAPESKDSEETTVIPARQESKEDNVELREPKQEVIEDSTVPHFQDTVISGPESKETTVTLAPELREPKKEPIEDPTVTQTSSSWADLCMNLNGTIPIVEITVDGVPMSIKEMAMCHKCEDSIMKFVIGKLMDRGEMKEVPMYRCLRQECQATRNIQIPKVHKKSETTVTPPTDSTVIHKTTVTQESQNTYTPQPSQKPTLFSEVTKILNGAQIPIIEVLVNGESRWIPEVAKCHKCPDGAMRFVMRKMRYLGELREYPAYRCARRGCQTFRNTKWCRV